MTSCSVLNCKSCTRKGDLNKNRHISFHKFPSDPKYKEIWIEATGQRNWFPTENSRICSMHFDDSSFKETKKFRRLIPVAIPTIDILKTSTRDRDTAPSDDSESHDPDMPATVKIEVDEEDISEHEDDIMEKLENRKRLHDNDPIAADPKMVKAELPPATESKCQQGKFQVILQPQQSQVPSQSQYVGVLQHKCTSHAAQSQAQPQPDTGEHVLVPECFMNLVARNQTEILSILKGQVLLQDPDPELLTFLRFLGSKLLRFPKEKRDELQDRITEMLLLE